MSHSKTDLTNAIDEYVFGSQAREIMMRSMYDRQPYEGTPPIWGSVVTRWEERCGTGGA